MKRLFTTSLLLSLTIIFSQCGSDDGNGNGGGTGNNIDADALAALLGTWNAESVTASGCDDSGMNGTNTCDDGTLLPCLSVQITDENLIGILDNTDPDFLENISGEISALSSTSISYCEFSFGSDGEECYTISYSFNSSTSFTASFTDSDAPGCTFTATFIKE